MIRIALVGDVGSGKSYISRLFDYPIFNADNEVSNIYKKDKKCFKKLKYILPNYFHRFPLKKQNLISAILDNKKNLKKITNIVHPIIKKKLHNFENLHKKSRFIILDIPLFLENKLNKKRDVIIFIKSDKKEILKYLKKRKGYNANLIKIFRKIQFSLEKKRKKSKYVIKNDFTKKNAKKYVNVIMSYIK